MAVLMRQVSDPIPPARSLNPEVDHAISDWIERMLVKDPADRTRSAAEAWDELEEIVIGLVGPRWRRSARLLEPSRRPPDTPAGPSTPPPTGAARPPLMPTLDPPKGPHRAGDGRHAPPPRGRPQAGTVMPEAPTRRLEQAGESRDERRGRRRGLVMAQVALALLGVLFALAAVLGSRGSQPRPSSDPVVAAPTSGSRAGPVAPGAAGMVAGAQGARRRPAAHACGSRRPARSTGRARGGVRHGLRRRGDQRSIAPGRIPRFHRQIGRLGARAHRRPAARSEPPGLALSQSEPRRGAPAGDRLRGPDLRRGRHGCVRGSSRPGRRARTPMRRDRRDSAAAARDGLSGRPERRLRERAERHDRRPPAGHPLGSAEPAELHDAGRPGGGRAGAGERVRQRRGAAQRAEPEPGRQDDQRPAARGAEGRRGRLPESRAGGDRVGDADAYRAASAAIPAATAKVNAALAAVAAAGYKPAAPARHAPSAKSTPKSSADAQGDSDVGDSRSDDPSDDSADP